MRVFLYTAPLRAQYKAASIEDAVEVPEERAEYLVEVGIARPAEAAEPAPEPEDIPEPAPDYAAMSKAELVALAEEWEIDVVRQDGEDGAPRKDDYIAALEAAGGE